MPSGFPFPLSSCTYYLSIGGQVIKCMERQKVLKELHTATWCPYSIRALKNLKEEMSQESDDVAYVLLHQYDELSCDAGETYGVFTEYIPNEFYNRYAEPGATSLNWIDWDRVKAMPALVNVFISADYNKKTRKLKIKVTGERNDAFVLLEKNTNLTVLLTENDVVAPQYDGEQGKFIYDFKHQAVLRTNVSAVWGDPVVWNGDKYEMNYSVTLDESWEKDNMKIVAFLAKPFTGSNYDEIYVKNCNDFAVKDANMVPLYTLTYMVDGKIYKTEEMEYGEKITTIVEPMKEGCTFSGWSEIPATMPAKNVTVTGTFTINKYKLTYMVDGENHKTSEVEYGASVTAEANPIKEGYTFSGWSEIPAKMPANDVTVTGTFTINKYKLTYMVDGENYKTSEVEYGATITREKEPTKEGYTFSGWSEIPATMPAKDVTVTGGFTINKYNLTYMIDGVTYKTSEVEYGASITAEANPKKEGYTFSGWSEIPATMPAKNVTVTGSFTINKYNLVYMIDGAAYKTSEVEYGASITAEANPIKEGYTFSGWSEIPATMPAKNVTVTGSFTINKYNLTYMIDGVTYKTSEVEYGTVIKPEAEPSKEGYTFSGWSMIPASMPAKDVTITGSFTRGQYKLTYIVDGEIYKTISLDYYDAVTVEAAPEKEGYTFSGWSETPATMPARDVTVTGEFTINKYTLTYQVDGEIYKTYDVEYGTDITAEEEPTKDGYAFSGWSLIPATMPAEDVTVSGNFTFIDAIEDVIADDEIYQICTLDGKSVKTLQKGVNVIHMSDGYVKKVFVK